MADNKVKDGTVVYVDGKTVGVNTSGEKEGDKLKVDLVLNVRAATIRARAADGTVEQGATTVATLRPGDKISAGWVPTTQGNLPTSVTVSRQGPSAPTGQTLTLNPGGSTPQELVASGQLHTPAGPLGSEHGPQAIQDGISHPELNYVNTTQQVGAGGPDRLDPTTPDGTPDAKEKLDRMQKQVEGQQTAAPEDSGAETDYEKLTVPELKKLAADRGVELESSDHKADIIDKLRDAE